MKRKAIRLRPVVSGSAACVFDIVNGFLNRCRGGIVASITIDRWYHHKINQIDYLAEIFLHTYPNAASMQGCR
jgi:hypothetical protein